MLNIPLKVVSDVFFTNLIIDNHVDTLHCDLNVYIALK